jgi:hypothetical protein
MFIKLSPTHAADPDQIAWVDTGDKVLEDEDPNDIAYSPGPHITIGFSGGTKLSLYGDDAVSAKTILSSFAPGNPKS